MHGTSVKKCTVCDYYAFWPY